MSLKVFRFGRFESRNSSNCLSNCFLLWFLSFDFFFFSLSFLFVLLFLDIRSNNGVSLC